MKPTLTVEAFRIFLQKAKELLPTITTPSQQRQSPSLDDFRGFLVQARALVLQDWPTNRPTVQFLLQKLQPYVLDEHQDLLQVAGLSFVENAYTNLLAWCLDPATHPATGLTRQRSWLELLGIQEGIHHPSTPMLQVRTDDGIPDLVLVYPTFFLVLEAKTGTAEHASPVSGRMQTFSYLESVRRKLGIDPTKAGIMIFLTPDGRDAANPEAVTTTFLDMVWAIARCLTPQELGEPIATLMRLIFTHWLAWATPWNLEIANVVRRADLANLSDDWCMANLNFVNEVHNLLSQGAIHAISRL